MCQILKENRLFVWLATLSSILNSWQYWCFKQNGRQISIGNIDDQLDVWLHLKH